MVRIGGRGVSGNTRTRQWILDWSRYHACVSASCRNQATAEFGCHSERDRSGRQYTYIQFLPSDNTMQALRQSAKTANFRILAARVPRASRYSTKMGAAVRSCFPLPPCLHGCCACRSIWPLMCLSAPAASQAAGQESMHCCLCFVSSISCTWS